MLSSPISAQALYATVRNPDLATYGPQVAKVSALLGHPLMPHQQTIADVSGEVLEDGSFRYPTVVVTIPRQSGKTTLLEAVNAHRCMTLPDFRSWYTAQTGLAAVDVWNEWARDYETAMGGRWRFRRSAGQNTALWTANGSFIRVFPPTPESLHSKFTDKVDLDEVWKLSMDAGRALTQAVVPTQATRRRRQLWIVSTAGDQESAWFRGWVERGRASVTDPDSRIAYFEYGIPDGQAWDDPHVWAQYLPAYGRTIDERGMLDAFDQMNRDEVEFRRAYGNQWPPAELSWKATWPKLVSLDPAPERPRIVLAVDAAPELRSASIVASWPIDSGRVALDVVDQRPGVDWVIERVRELSRKHRAPVVLHRGSPIGYLVEELKSAGVRVDAIGGEEYVTAGQRFRALVAGALVTHRNDPRLNDAVDAAIARESGDRTTWRRKDTTVDISPLVAASMAAWKASATPRKPQIRGA